MAPPSSPSPSLTQLKEELHLQETLLESLEGQEDAEEQKQDITANIRSLEQQIAKMQPPLPDWGSTYDQIPVASHHLVNDEHVTPTDNAQSYYDPFLAPPANPSITLPSRKRPRNDFDDELATLHLPGMKSIRTPTPRTTSPAPSVDSFNTDFSDDLILKKLLGTTYEEGKRMEEEYLRELELKKQQEEEDAAFARQLQQQWSRDSQSTSTVPKPAPPTGNYSQSFLRPDGSTFREPALNDSEIEVISDRGLGELSSFVSGTSTPNSDESGLEEITPLDWISRFGQPSRRTLAQNMSPAATYSYNDSMRLPGAFPGSGSLYSSAPGTSVYGNSPYSASQFDSTMSSFNNYPPNLFGNHPLTNRALMGSSRMPFNLDNYPLSPALSYADPEQTQEEIKDLLKHIRPDEELTPQQLAEIQPEGLKVNLMPHQRKGFAWMKSMEEGTNKGGILADDMGLGKTIQALALILGRPPAPDADGRRPHKPTLIVAPVALMQQWEREIKKHIHRSHRLNVLILHGNNRNSSWTDIRTYDVVLTTYGLLASDLKRREQWDKRLKMVPNARPSPQEQCPVLGERSKFHRVILDEAQNIKNKSTKAAVAACRIAADHRWCLSGTPMQNNVDEIFSLIKFCRIRPYCDVDKFSKDIGRPLRARGINYGREKAMQQLQALLRAVLLRRTKKSEIDGQPILQLPEKRTVEERTVFSKDELDFYKALETQAQIQFNKYLKNGTVGRNYSHALVLLLRLRQCCCSPQLVTNAKDFLVNGALQDLDYVENARLLPKDVIRRLSDLDAFECPICMDGVENPIIFNPCGHSLCQECLSTMVDKAMADSESHKVTCPHCRAVIDTNKVTDHESFLRVHFPDRPGVEPLAVEGSNDKDETDVTNSDSSDEDSDSDSDDGEDLQDFVVPDKDDVEYDSDESESATKKHIKKRESENDVKNSKTQALKSKADKKKKRKPKDTKGKGKKKSRPETKTLAQLRAEGLRSRAAKKKYISRLARGYQPSTKIEKTVRLLRDIKANGEGEKTIIFSSFTSFLDLLEVEMNRDDDDEMSNYTRYDGSMSAKDRNEAVNRFTDDAKCKAILVSLKAGNAGLNLTVANHVVILDPFWNPFVEYQAADRCYRIGQLKEVTIHRILIGQGDEEGNLIQTREGENQEFTVEDRILALQEKKRMLVETALDEQASGNIGRLGVRELGYLFGVNTING